MNPQTMNTHTRHRLAVAAATAAVLLVGACSGEPTAGSTSPSNAVTSSSEAVTTSTTSATTEPASAAETIDRAVDRLIEAGSYAFEAKTLVTLQGQPIEIELEGWVDGSDRELVMTIDRQSVTTRVIDGVATVDRDGETVEVPLEEAGEAPSILILNDLQNPTFDGDNTITGKLNASDLSEFDLDVNGSATIEITVDRDGDLAGYTILSNNDSWSVEVKFEDIGQSPNT